MKKTYQTPSINVHTIACKTYLLNSSIKVNGDAKVESTSDIGFAREENYQDDSFWD